MKTDKSSTSEKLENALIAVMDAYRDCAYEEMTRSGDPWMVYRCIKNLMAAESKLRKLQSGNWIA